MNGTVQRGAEDRGRRLQAQPFVDQHGFAGRTLVAVGVDGGDPILEVGESVVVETRRARGAPEIKLARPVEPTKDVVYRQTRIRHRQPGQEDSKRLQRIATRFEFVEQALGPLDECYGVRAGHDAYCQGAQENQRSFHGSSLHPVTEWE